MKRIFVYGSLREGFGNWRYFLHGNSTKLGNCVVEGNYAMHSFGGFPAVKHTNVNPTHIVGEVYEVSDVVYQDIEHLESYPSFYDREKVDTPWGEADMYIILNDELSDKPIIESGDWKEYIEKKYS